jgi:hypothetical protein
MPTARSNAPAIAAGAYHAAPLDDNPVADGRDLHEAGGLDRARDERERIGPRQPR